MPKQAAKQTITAELPQSVQPFKPTLHMINWLDTAIQLATDSPTPISAKNEQRRENWYDWLKIDGFEDWFYENYKKKRRRWLPKLDEIGLKMADKDFKYWEAMNKKAGEILDGASTNVQVNVLNQIKKDKEEFDL